MNINRLILYAGIFALYSIGFTGEFQFDDYYWIHVPAWMGVQPHIPGRPIPSALLSAIYSVGGLNAVWYKVVSVAIHIGVIDCMYRICKRFKTSPLMVVAFAVHPVLVTTVAYPVQQSVMLATLACGWAFLAYDARKYAVSAVLCAVAMMCKQNAYVFPVVLVLYEWLVNRKKSLAIPLFMGVSLALWYVLTHDLNTNFTNHMYSPWTRLTTQGYVMFKYLFMVILPHNQYTISHEIEVIKNPIWLMFWIMVIACVYVHSNERGRWIWLALVVMCLPEFTVMNLELMFEHRLYLPLAMICCAVPRFRVQRWVFLTIISWLIACNINFQLIWKSQERLWKHTLRLYPNSYRAHENLGKLLYKANPLESLYHLSEAMKCTDRSNGKWSADMAVLYKTYIDAEIIAEFNRFRNKRLQQPIGSR